MTLLIIKAKGIKKGRVSSVHPKDWTPGLAEIENVAGQWAFVYLNDAMPEDVSDFMDPEIEDNPQARDTVPIAERVKNDIIRPRLDYIDLDNLPTMGLMDFSTYFPFENPKAYRITSAQLNAQRKKERDR